MKVNQAWQEAFRNDIVANIKRKSNNFTRQLFMKDIWLEAKMYSCDICLHYYKTGAYKGITRDTIDDITYNVCVAMSKLIPEFDESQYSEVYDGVHSLLCVPETNYDILQEQINNYYGY